MKHRAALPIALGLTSVLPGGALHASEARMTVLEPDSKWVADYGENNCRIIRTFGDKENRTALIIEQTAPTAGFIWTVAGPPLAKTRWSQPVQVQWGPEFNASERQFVDSTLGSFGSAYMGRGWGGGTDGEPITNKNLHEIGSAKLSSGLKPVLAEINVERAAGVEYLMFRQDDRVAFALQLDHMGSAINALNKCTSDLAASWGFDDSYRQRLSTKPVWTNVPEIARRIQRNYPSQALRRGAQADFKLRIIVDDAGKPERCDWINNTAADDFEMSKTPCDIVMERAEFEPALDENEQPIRSIYETAVVYRMP